MDKKSTQMFKENSNELITTKIDDVGKKRKCFTLIDFLGQFEEKYNSLISQLTMKFI